MKIPPKPSADKPENFSTREAKTPPRLPVPVVSEESEKSLSDDKMTNQLVESTGEKRKAEKSPSRTPPLESDLDGKILTKSAFYIGTSSSNVGSTKQTADVSLISGSGPPHGYDIKVNWDPQEIRRLWAGPIIPLISRSKSAATHPSPELSIKLIVKRSKLTWIFATDKLFERHLDKHFEREFSQVLSTKDMKDKNNYLTVVRNLIDAEPSESIWVGLQHVQYGGSESEKKKKKAKKENKELKEVVHQYNIVRFDVINQVFAAFDLKSESILTGHFLDQKEFLEEAGDKVDPERPRLPDPSPAFIKKQQERMRKYFNQPLASAKDWAQGIFYYYDEKGDRHEDRKK